jgi:hypothetical protein
MLPDLRGFGDNLSGLDDLINRVQALPESNVRDRFVLAICNHGVPIYYDSYLRKHTMDYTVKNLEQYQQLMSLMSAEGLRAHDVGNPKANITSLKHPIISLPIIRESTDIAERFPFIKSNSNEFIPFVSRYADMFNSAYPAANPEELMKKVNRIVSGIPHASGVRDYLLEAALMPLIKADSRYAQMKHTDKVALLDQVYFAARTTRTRGMLAGELVNVRLEQLDPNATYQERLAIVTSVMPELSSARDKWINEVLNSSFTTWEDISQAEKN